MNYWNLLVSFGNFSVEKIIIFNYWKLLELWKIMECWYRLCLIEMWIIGNLLVAFGNFSVEKIIIFEFWNYWNCWEILGFVVQL